MAEIGLLLPVIKGVVDELRPARNAEEEDMIYVVVSEVNGTPLGSDMSVTYVYDNPHGFGVGDVVEVLIRKVGDSA